MIFRWFFSRTVRLAVALCRHVQRLTQAQRDQISEQAAVKMTEAIASVRQSVASRSDKKTLRRQMAELDQAAAEWLKPFPHPSIRENVEVILVAVAVAVSIHTFFLKPFKIPTGSMQPTLYGIVAESLRDRPEFIFPTGLKKLCDFWINGYSYYHIVAKTDGMLESRELPRMILPFLYQQRLKVGETWYTIWSPWDRLLEETGVQPGHLYRQGEDIIKARVFAGDHLFVDRITYNFRRPERGEIIVFKTEGIKSPFTGLPAMPQDQFYIKRMVAMGGERVQLGNDRHLMINGSRLDQTTPRFENVYSFNPRQPARENHYSGHVNDWIAARDGKPGLAPLFPDENTTVTLRSNHYMVMGDNTMNSLDSRSWGDFPRTNVIGKYFFVYWPISMRFGLAAR